MEKPIRLQRRRIKGFDLQSASPNDLPIIYVGRPSKWGNPFKASNVFGPNANFVVVSMFRSMMLNIDAYTVDAETRERFRYMRDRIRDLEGKNLACFCPIGSECHADVLLKLANP